MTLSAAAEAHRSWSWLIAALVAYGLFLFFAPLIKKIKSPSPTPSIEGVRRTKVQATVGVTEDEPAEPAEIGWWGRIVEKGGVRWRQTKQIMATGSHELPEEPGPEAEDEAAEDDDEGEKIEEYIVRARDLRVPYNQIVRVVVEYYGVSESTAKRRIREVDEARRAA